MVQKTPKKIKLAFLINFNHQKWLGGMNIIINLINAILINKNNAKKIKVVLVTDQKKNFKNFDINKNVEILEDKFIFKLNLFQRFIEKFLLLIRGKTFFLEKFLTKNQINFISHSNIVSGKNSFTKSIVWIPDFQYLHYPQYFPLKYRFFRKINLNIFAWHSHKILLSSNDAYNDLRKIKKVNNDKIIIHPFTWNVPDPKKLIKFSIIKNKYSLPRKYFYLPNQYWLHKNHITAIKALRELNVKDKKITIVSTGQSHDYRKPDHFKQLLKIIKNNNLQNNYIYLGVVPYLEVMTLIYNSVAVLNPSLFEGWSSTVEQAKSYGKKIVLSDINVHLEHKPDNGYYFNPNNFKKLSILMLNIQKKSKNKKTKNLLLKYRSKMKKNFEDYGKQFSNIILN